MIFLNFYPKLCTILRRTTFFYYFTIYEIMSVLLYPVNSPCNNNSYTIPSTSPLARISQLYEYNEIDQHENLEYDIMLIHFSN